MNDAFIKNQISRIRINYLKTVLLTAGILKSDLINLVLDSVETCSHSNVGCLTAFCIMEHEPRTVGLRSACVWLITG